MSDLDDYLSRWRAADVIDAETADRIRAFEAGDEARHRDERPGIMEALIYIGLAVVGVGAFILMALVWGDLDGWARIAVTGAPGLAALGLGQVLYSMGQPGMQRGGSVAWVAAAALLTGCVAVIVYEAGWDDSDAVIVPAIVAVALTLALWALLPWHPQVVALGAALTLFAISIAVRSDHDGPAVFATVIAALAIAWIAVTELKVLGPRATARPLGALALAGGGYLLSLDWDLPLVVEGTGFIAGIALVVLSILRGSFAYMVFGIGVLFVSFVTFTMQRVPDPVVGALVLMLSGVLLVATVIILARWRPWQGTEAAT